MAQKYREGYFDSHEQMVYSQRAGFSVVYEQCNGF